MPKLYFSSVEPGDPVTPMTKPPVTRVQIARFAGASQDYSPLHIDDEFAKSAGYGGVFAHGLIGLGFATEAISRWLENGRILTVATKFQKLVWPGDILTAKGVVVDVEEEGGEFRINVDVWTENQNHDIVMKGQVTCLLFEDEKAEKKSKTPWPLVSEATISGRKTAEPIEKPKSARPRPASQTADKPPPKTLSRGSPVAEAKASKKADGAKASEKPKDGAEKKSKKAAAKKAAPAKKAPAKKAASKKAPAAKAAKKVPAKKADAKKKKKK